MLFGLSLVGALKKKAFLSFMMVKNIKKKRKNILKEIEGSQHSPLIGFNN
jgi:hypothetical protein